MAATGSPSNSQPNQHDNNHHSQNLDPHSTQPQQPDQFPPLSETLVSPNSPEIQNSQQSDKLLNLDAEGQQSQQNDDHQSGTDHSTRPEPIILTDDAENPPPAPPVMSPTNLHRRVNKRKKAGSRKTYKRKRPTKRMLNLTDNLNPIPFEPAKKLDLDKHEDVLRRLGLYEFSKIEFDRSIRTDLIVQLIVNYDPKKRGSIVEDFRIAVNRADLARALKLPPPKQDRGSGVEEVDLDSEVFSDEAIRFVEDFVFNWMVLRDESLGMPQEIVNWTRCIRDGHPEKLDCASLIWYNVEKELSQGDKLVNCYYASYLQQLIRSQKDLLFKDEEDDDGAADDGDEIVKVDYEKDEKEQEETGMKDVKEEQEKPEMKGEKEEQEKTETKDEKEQEKAEMNDEKEELEEAGMKDEKEEQEETEMKDEKEEQEETEMKGEKEEDEVKGDEKEEDEVKDEKEEEDKVFIGQEQNIELTLGTDVEETADEEVKKDDETMADAEECREEMEEQGNFKNMLGEHFLQRCQSGDLNNFEEIKAEEVEEEQIEQVEEDDDEEEGEEENGERMDEGFDMEANDDAFDRDGLTDNFLQGVETSHNPYNSHGMSSMDLFGSRDGSFMSHGGPSFYNNGGKRVMGDEEDIRHLDQNSKRLKTDEIWDQKQNDINFCFEQMQQLMQKAKMIHESKERNYEDLQYSQQMTMNQLHERHQFLEMIIKSKDEELEKKRAEVFRLERELYLMGDLLSGYRKALNDTRFKFSEYRKRFVLKEEPLYKDAGPGGLVLSTREIEKQRLKQEEDMMKFQILAKNFEEECVYQLEMHNDRLLPMVDKLVFIENEVQRLKEFATQHKDTQEPSAELEPSVEPEENQKLLDENELSEKNQKLLDEKELSENNQKPVDENELSVEAEGSQKLQDETPENDAIMESVPPDADESEEKEKRGGEEH